MQVFAALDLETGDDCVVKRPHPSLVTRNLHDDVERRTSLQAELRANGPGLVGLPQLLAVTAPDRLEWYFGDDLGNAYSVQVERRARGVPLLGSIGDQVRRLPVALPINLFVLHPSAEHLRRNLEDPSLTVLGVIEGCLDLGFLAGDLGPRNLFYSPRTGDATVIDLGSLNRPRQEGRRTRALDLNDVLFEFFQFYTSPDSLPTSPEAFTRISEQRHSGTLERMARSMGEKYEESCGGEQRDAAGAILHGIAQRTYQSVSDFRSDFKSYLNGTAARLRHSPTEHAWSSALNGLRDSYWTKYLFDANRELSYYGQVN